MERDGLEQGEVGQVNWIKELKAEMKARKSTSNNADDIVNKKMIVAIWIGNNLPFSSLFYFEYQRKHLIR